MKPARRRNGGARQAALRRRIATGAVLALVLGAGLAIGLGPQHRPAPPPPVSQTAAIPAPPPAPIIERPPPAPPPAAAMPPAEQQQHAAIVPPPPPAPPKAEREPQWLRYAMPAPAPAGRAMVAIVIDDLGLDRKGAEAAIALDGRVTLSFMSYAPDLARLTSAAHEAGHEMIVHVPMEPLDGHIDSGPRSLLVRFDRDEILQRLRWDLDRFTGYVGINNHMGSRFTSDPRGMTTVLDELRSRGLLFLDSRTAASSVGNKLAAQMGVPHAARDIFLDDTISVPAIDAQLGALEKLARKRGSAIAIGHPHPATIAALAAWLPTLQARHLVLVPLTAIVRARIASG
jgi:polysaccharide deacetylase 2 family uncharacterized protein YibQ